MDRICFGASEEQVKMGYEPPNLDSFLYPTTYRDTETRLIPSPMKRKSQQTESPKKQKGNTLGVVDFCFGWSTSSLL
jgi:hypothetical protein